jgi:hypothetical protein
MVNEKKMSKNHVKENHLGHFNSNEIIKISTPSVTITVSGHNGGSSFLEDSEKDVVHQNKNDINQEGTLLEHFI